MSIYGLFSEMTTSLPSNLLSDFNNEGFVILPDLLNSSEVNYLINLTDKYLEIQEKESINNGLNLQKINEENLLRCPLYYHRDFYRLLCLNPKVTQLVSHVLGANYQLHLQNAVINKPNINHHQATWHRDFPYQPFLPNRCMAISIFFCLTDFSEETGGTCIVPRSHRLKDNEISLDMLENNKLIPQVKAGGAIVFDSFLWHRSGKNMSSFSRYGINNVFTTPILKQQISLPDFLPSGYCESEVDQKILGYKWSQPKSVLELRAKK